MESDISTDIIQTAIVFNQSKQQSGVQVAKYMNDWLSCPTGVGFYNDSSLPSSCFRMEQEAITGTSCKIHNDKEV